ncbi:MAG: alpha/beta hydrolase [Proteobacteria bacterium]|nr:alpha/beta hydrolase [Pseudomonadota bacterium]
MDKALKKAGIEEQYFHTGEIKMNYVAGPPNGTPLVFIPGQIVTWEEYSLIMPELADRFQVFAVSLRGHGKSSWTPGKYTFNQLGKDMTAFLKGVVGKPAIVAGNSSGGVLTSWLAANSPKWVKAIVLEDPALFTSEWPAIKDTWVYDMFLGLSRMAIAGGGGYSRFFLEELMRAAEDAKGVMDMKVPPKPIQKIIACWIAVKQAFYPGSPIDLKILPKSVRILVKSTSQFDGNFSRAFVEGTAGEGFDHATTLAKITQPILYLHANWFMHQGRLLGAQDDNHVARVKSLVKGPWKYVRLNCGHAVALEVPVEEAKEILSWVDEYVK